MSGTREWEEELPSFIEGPDVNGGQDATNHPLRLHRLTINRREDSPIISAGCSFLPARTWNGCCADDEV